MIGDVSYEVVRALALALDAKDPLTRHHSDRVARYALALGTKLGLEPERLENLVVAAFLHDIGVLGVPDFVLQKDGELAQHELQTMREHAVIGERILDHAGLGHLSKFVRHHHERIDGTGYPDGLKGEAIPIESRIICVVEALESMTAARYGQQVRSGGSALDELEGNRGTQFDPEVTDLLLDLLVSQELDQVAFDETMGEVIREARLHDPEWVLSRQAQRKRRLSSVVELDLERVTPSE
jgi:polar amino acid transport system substrate-binding protein